jgi:hypothetical protein
MTELTIILVAGIIIALFILGLTFEEQLGKALQWMKTTTRT